MKYRGLFAAISGLVVLASIVVLYLPVSQAGFVWDDKLCFHDAPWLRYGDEWTHYMFRDFCEWSNYFRPLVVAILTFEIRAFDAAPGPMHVVSLMLHLVNTILVGVLASHALRLTRERDGQMLPVAAMLIYGVHPALVEPVVWIGCQFDLFVTMFTLLALIANARLAHTGLRAALIASCFFLAACAKESAIALPLVVFVADLILFEPQAHALRPVFRSLLRRQWPVYLGLLVAGFAYLGLRYWGLGYLVRPAGHQSIFTLAHLQEVSRTYVEYLRLIVWPMSELGPLHLEQRPNFGRIDAGSLGVDALALGVFAVGAWCTWRRIRIGSLILLATAALFPVLRIIPLGFDASLYHERYAMTSIALVCALLPFALGNPLLAMRSRLARAGASVGLLLWVVACAANVRVTVPLWSDNLALWQWALRKNPQSVVAKDHLLSAYIERRDYAQARVLAKSIEASGAYCPTCTMNSANLAIAEGDVPWATSALAKLDHDRVFLYSPQFLRSYVLAKGELLELRGDLEDAETAYRECVRMDNLDPIAQGSLAKLLVRTGRIEEGRAMMRSALALYAVDERAQRSREFEKFVSDQGTARTR